MHVYVYTSKRPRGLKFVFIRTTNSEANLSFSEFRAQCVQLALRRADNSMRSVMLGKTGAQTNINIVSVHVQQVAPSFPVCILIKSVLHVYWLLTINSWL